MLNVLLWIFNIAWILIAIYAVLFKSTDDNEPEFKYPPPEYFGMDDHKDKESPAEKHYRNMRKK